MQIELEHVREELRTQRAEHRSALAKVRQLDLQVEIGREKEAAQRAEQRLQVMEAARQQARGDRSEDRPLSPRRGAAPERGSVYERDIRQFVSRRGESSDSDQPSHRRAQRTYSSDSEQQPQISRHDLHRSQSASFTGASHQRPPTAPRWVSPRQASSPSRTMAPSVAESHATRRSAEPPVRTPASYSAGFRDDDQLVRRSMDSGFGDDCEPLPLSSRESARQPTGTALHSSAVRTSYSSDRGGVEGLRGDGREGHAPTNLAEDRARAVAQLQATNTALQQEQRQPTVSNAVAFIRNRVGDGSLRDSADYASRPVVDSPAPRTGTSAEVPPLAAPRSHGPEGRAANPLEADASSVASVSSQVSVSSASDSRLQRLYAKVTARSHSHN